MFKSLSYFEFILVHGVRVCSNFIDLHGAVQLSQQHLLKRLYFPHCVWVCFWAVYPVPLIHTVLITVCCPISDTHTLQAETGGPW